MRLLDASVWHPIMPEQKRGRDASAEMAARLVASHCQHHFVSSWIQHDKEKHARTERGRGAGAAAAAVGQSVRASNPWKSFKLGGGGGGGGDQRRGGGGGGGGGDDDQRRSGGGGGGKRRMRGKKQAQRRG